MSEFAVEKIRSDFPVLKQSMNGKPLVYLDNAATTQKPNAVIRRLERFYTNEYATIHRGVYSMSQQATFECEESREKCRKFLGAREVSEIIFVRGATEGLNLVASSYGRKFLKAGDEILISAIEHHANIVPWQILAKETGAALKVIPVLDSGELDQDAYKKLLSEKVKIVAITHMSNALGTIVPVKEMTALAHEVGAIVVLDGAQAVPHMKVDVRDIDCDFYTFSSHKLFGPTGVGVLYGKLALLEAMDPYQSGGDMIEHVTFEKTTYAKPPAKFEAGTPAIAEIIGLGAAIDYVESLGFQSISSYENELLRYATERLREVESLRIIGQAPQKGAVISFVFEDIHPHDIGTILDQEGIAIRTGHHCAHPVMQRFGVPATARASFSLYNTFAEVDVLVESLKKVRAVFE